MILESFAKGKAILFLAILWLFVLEDRSSIFLLLVKYKFVIGGALLAMVGFQCF